MLDELIRTIWDAITSDKAANLGSFLGGFAALFGIAAVWAQVRSLRLQIEASRKADMPEVVIEVEVEGETKGVVFIGEWEFANIPEEGTVRIIIINPKNVPVFLKKYDMVASGYGIAGRIEKIPLTDIPSIKNLISDDGMDTSKRVLRMGDTYRIYLPSEFFERTLVSRIPPGVIVARQSILRLFFHGIPEPIMVRFINQNGMIYYRDNENKLRPMLNLKERMRGFLESVEVYGGQLFEEERRELEALRKQNVRYELLKKVTRTPDIDEDKNEEKDEEITVVIKREGI